MKKLLIALVTVLLLTGCGPKELTMEDISKMEVLDTNSYTISAGDLLTTLETVDDDFYLDISFKGEEQVAYACKGDYMYLATNDGTAVTWMKAPKAEDISADDITDTQSYFEYLDATDLQIVETKDGITYVTGQAKVVVNEDYVTYTYTVKFTYEGNEVIVKQVQDYYSDPEIISGELPENFFDDYSFDFDTSEVTYWGDDTDRWGEGFPMEILSKESDAEEETCQVNYEFNSDGKIVAFEYVADGINTRVTMNPKISALSFVEPENASEVEQNDFAWAILSAMINLIFIQ